MKYIAQGLVMVIALSAVGLIAVGWREGYRVYAIQTGSMYPTHPIGALVVDAPAQGRSIRVGDVITFRTQNGLVTHRVYSVNSASGRESTFKTKGDANRTPDAWTLPQQNIAGTVIWGSAYLGYVFVFFQQPTGILSLMLLCISVWCAWSAFFTTNDPPSEQAASLPGGEPLRLSDDEATAATRLPEDPTAADEGGVICLPHINVVAAEGIGGPAA